jgi:hypothetical protein
MRKLVALLLLLTLTGGCVGLFNRGGSSDCPHLRSSSQDFLTRGILDGLEKLHATVCITARNIVRLVTSTPPREEKSWRH